MRCEQCGTIFCWDFADVETVLGHRKRYCSASCQKRAAPSSRRRRNKIGRIRACREQGKKRYESYDHAGRVAKLIWCDSGDTLRPYKCPCGWWHLTSKEADSDR
jgi:hypothetical protein